MGVWSAGPVLSRRDRSFTEPVNGMRRILQLPNHRPGSITLNSEKPTTDHRNLILQPYLASVRFAIWLRLSFIQRTTTSSKRSCQGLITLGPSSEGLGALRATTFERSIYWNRLSWGPEAELWSWSWSWSWLADQSESNSTNVLRKINLWDSLLQLGP